MRNINLPVNQIVNLREFNINKSFKIIGIDLVSLKKHDFPVEFGLFFDNNSENLKLENTYTHYIGFKPSPHYRGYYIPESKKICKLFNYCQLLSDTPLDVNQVSFHIEIKY